ncbi:ferric reductase like transmembrane component [Phyllosticta paracitricarpa]
MSAQEHHLARRWGNMTPEQMAALEKALKDDFRVMSYLGYTWVACAIALTIWLVCITFTRYVRGIACLNNPAQRYFYPPNEYYGKFKRYLFDSPLFRTRHHREYKLSSAINIGTLPNRLQTIYISAYVGMNIAFCVIFIDWSSSMAVAKMLRNRSGNLAVMNMLALFLLAGRNNILLKLTGIPYDTYNLLHRWIGRVVIIEALTHTLAYLVPSVKSSGWSHFGSSLSTSQFILWGTIGTLAFLVIFLQAAGPLRHAFYEFFLHFHIFLAALAVAGVYIHLKVGELPNQLALLQGTIAIWVIDRAVRLWWIVLRNFGNGGTQAEVEVLPGECLRINLKVARPWKFRTGQHIYLYMPKLGWWTSHPFSLSWSENDSSFVEEKGSAVDIESIDRRQKTVSLLVRRRTGFTNTLWQKAEASPSGKFVTSAIAEGPYGFQDLDSYGTVMLFAAGIGITHQVPHVRHLVDAYSKKTAAVRRLTLVWIIQSPEHLEWIRPWMTEILSMPQRREVLKILLFVTRPRSTKEIHSPSSSVQMFPGKPNVQALVDQEMVEGVGAAAVSVCGTGSLADDVRFAVRTRQTRWNVDFFEEAFSW